MQKRKFNRKNDILIAHKSKNRVRIVVKNLKPHCDTDDIISKLLELEYVKSARVNLKAKSIIVEYSCDLKIITEFIKNLEIKNIYENKTDADVGEIYKNALVIAFGPLLKRLYLLGGVSVYSTFSILKSGMQELINEGITSKVLESLAVGVSLARKDYLAANATALLLNIGEYIEESTSIKSDDLIKELAKPNIDEIWIEKTLKGKKTLKKVFFDEVKVGDIVVVGAGESIGVDGYIIEGSASVNQISMTGEAEPVKKDRGDRVMSGTVVEEGKIKIWAELVGDQTATSRIKQYIQSSLDEKSKIGLKANKLADKLVPVTLSIAGISYLVNRNFMSVASVLQADYSCALKLATPVAFKSSISKAGKNGVLLKGSDIVENLSQIDAFVFDKTGTLTHGKLEVVEINSFDDKFSKDDILNLTASAEEHYFHPVAEAVVKAANMQGFKHIHHDEVEFIVAHGVKTFISNKEVLIGSRHFLEDDEKISFKKADSFIKKSIDDGLTMLYISYDKKLIGTIGMRDKIRQNAKEVLQNLKKAGIKKTVMLTGDIKSKAEETAKLVGIDEVYYELLPTQKAQIIDKLKSQGYKVAFIGDGINDAPSLMNADVGISMQKGADITKATADISLLKDDLQSLVFAKELSDKTISLILRNFNITVGINSLILFAAAIGKLTPVKTALLHNGTTIGLLLSSISGVNVKKG